MTTLALLAALASSAGCSKQEPAPTGPALLIGKWEQIPVEDPTKGLVPAPTISFGEDGTFVMEVKSAPEPLKAGVAAPPLRTSFTWTFESEHDGLMTIFVTHPAGRTETMLIRVPVPNRLQVEGKSPATFRRVG